MSYRYFVSYRAQSPEGAEAFGNDTVEKPTLIKDLKQIRHIEQLIEQQRSLSNVTILHLCLLAEPSVKPEAAAS